MPVFRLRRQHSQSTPLLKNVLIDHRASSLLLHYILHDYNFTLICKVILLNFLPLSYKFCKDGAIFKFAHQLILNTQNKCDAY